MTPADKATWIKTVAAELGIDRLGITHAGPSERGAYYREWLAAGHAGTMRHLYENVPMRENPEELLPGAKSIICIAVSYRREDPTPNTDGATFGKVARYARGRDYHPVLWRMLNRLARMMRGAFDEPFEHRICVDTAPLLERELAARAGVGWVGKNTILLNDKLGTYLLLGELLTTLELEADAPATDHCGSCTKCLDACPTQAFTAPYQLDASRCIAYLTIENRQPIPDELKEQVGDWVFGCDVCQEVCPYNRRAPLTRNPELAAETTPGYVDLPALLNLTAGGYRRLTRGSASRRATMKMWRRNAANALSNLKKTGPSSEA